MVWDNLNMTKPDYPTGIEWQDVAMHTAAVLVLMALFGFALSMSWFQAIIAVTLIMMVRELTQIQSRFHANNFLRGWKALFTNLRYLSEWLFPVIAGAILGVVL